MCLPWSTTLPNPQFSKSSKEKKGKSKVAREIDYTKLRLNRMRRRKLMRTLYPYILLFAALTIIYFIFSLRNIVKPASYVPRVQTVYAQQIATSSAVPLQSDKRISILENFLKGKDSPLASYSEFFIETADKYGLDWTLMPAISGMESSFGKTMPEGSNNPFGLGGGNLMRFPTLYSAIEFEGKLLSKKYKLAANHAIGSIYCPKYECNQNWAVIVTNFSEEILN